MTIHIGAMLPEKALEQSPFNRSLTAIAIALHGLRRQQTSNTLSIYVVFQLAGQQEKPTFEGLVMQKFNSSNQSLHFQAAVPQAWTAAERPDRYILAVLKDAVDAAAEFCQENNISYDSQSQLTQIDGINVGNLDIPT